MASTKAIQIGKELDLARCNGNWLAIHDLARRYKKYNADGSSKNTKKKKKKKIVEHLPF
jgi:hypothetical protein